MSLPSAGFFLPQPPVVFTGRRSMAEKLKKAFHLYKLMVIDGIKGIGKTSFALHFANMISEDKAFKEYHEKIMWLQCEEGWTVKSLLYELNYYLKEKGEEGFDIYLKDSEVDFKGKLMALISLLNKNNYLLFIDDYQIIMSPDSFKMLQLLKRFLKNSRVIIISNIKPDFTPVEWMDIFELTIRYLNKKESLSLINTLLDLYYEGNQDRKISGEISKRLGGHPFLIKSFLSLLMTGDRTVEELLEQVSGFHSVSDKYIMTQLLKDLGEREKEFLLSFSIYRKAVKKDGIRLIYKGEDIEEIVDNLKKKFLLDCNLDKNYSIHSLLREFCYERSEKKSLHKICASYYINSVKSGERDYLEDLKEAFYHYYQAEEYEKACKTLEKILYKMMTYFQLDELENNIDLIIKVLANIPYSIILTKAEVLRLKGKSKEAIEILKNNISGRDEYEKSQFLIFLARLHSRLGDWELSLDLINESTDVYNKLNNKSGLARAYSFKGSVYRLKGDDLKALEFYQKSRKLNEEIKNTQLDLKNRQSLAIIMMKKGEFDEALKVLKECLKEVEEMNWTGMKLSLRNNLALVHYELDNYNKALGLWNENIEICGSFGWKEARMHALTGSALIYEEYREQERAISHYREALDVSRECEDNYLQCLILSRLGSLLIKQNEIEEAEEITEEALSICSEYNFSTLYGEIKLNMAEFSFINGNRDKTGKNLDEILKIDDHFLQGKAWHFKYILEGSEDFRDKTKEKINSLYGSRRKRAVLYIKYLDELSYRISPRETLKEYNVKMRDRVYKATITEVESLRKGKDQFDLFIDAVNGKILEKEKGEITIFNKKILPDLLFFFVRHGGEFFAPRDIFPEVWKGKYVHDTDGPNVKMSIARLRKLMEPDCKNPKYLKISPVRYKNERKYYFEDNSNFCFIEKIGPEE